MTLPRGLFALALLTACGSPSSPATVDGALAGDGARRDGPANTVDAAGYDAITADDGPPTRQPCTSQFGNALSTSFGRLDGILVADEVHTTTRDLPLPGMPWSEGWHTGVSDDYPTLGVHAADLVKTAEPQLTSDLMTDLATVNHITVYATGYGPTGAHLVHRNGGGRDGLVITQPLSTPAHARMFSFTTQSF
jgi:hypothetical protein